MLKKSLIASMVLILLLSTSSIYAQMKISLGIEGGYFGISDDAFADLYDSGGIEFGVAAGIELLQDLELQAAFNLFSKEGKTSLSQEAITLKVNNIRIACLYHIQLGSVIPHVGAGLTYSMVTEENPIEDFDDNALGWLVQGGISYPLSDNLVIKADLIFSDVKMTGDLGDVKIGGLHFLAAIHYIF